MKNKYIHRAKISEKKFKRLLELFCLDLTASQIADVSGINRNTVNRYVGEIRTRISEYCRSQVVESSSCYTGGCDQFDFMKEEVSTCKARLVGIIKNNGKISCRIIPDKLVAQVEHLKGSGKNGNPNRPPAIPENCNGFIDLRRMKYVKIQLGDKCEGRGIDICDGFWGFVRARIQRFRGLRKHTVMLHIQECEFRYNHGRDKIYPVLLQIIREQPLF